MSATINLLSLQGGGTRGIMQAAILRALSQSASVDAPIPPGQWSLIGGTSVGSIVGGCLAAGASPGDMIKFFVQSAPKIFSGLRAWLPSHLFAAIKYDPAALRDALTAVAGNKTLADCQTNFIATAMEMNTGRLAYFQSYGKSAYGDPDELVIGPDSGMPLVDVMLASSAAQHYFPAHEWREFLFIDGGNTGFNAPDMLVLDEAKALFPLQFGALQMLSLGGGNAPWPYRADSVRKAGLIELLKLTLTVAYAGPEEAMVWLAQNELNGRTQRHYRLNPVIPEIAIDDASQTSLLIMQNAAARTLREHPEAQAFCPQPL